MAESTYKTRALVLRRTKLKESDLILTLLAEDGSQKRVVAKGARKPKNSFAARTELFCLCDILCAQGRSLDIAKEVRLINSHAPLRSTLEASALASPSLELLGRVSQPDLENAKLFQVTERAFEVMDESDDTRRVALACAHLLKILAFSGLRPSFEQCCSCGREAFADPEQIPERIFFSATEGSIVCSDCRSQTECVPLDTATILWARYLLGSRFDDIAAADVDVSECFAVLHLIQSFIRAHIGSPLKSLEFLFGVGLW